MDGDLYFTSSLEEEWTDRGSEKAFPEQASDDELRAAGVRVGAQKNHSLQKPVAGGSTVQIAGAGPRALMAREGGELSL